MDWELVGKAYRDETEARSIARRYEKENPNYSARIVSRLEGFRVQVLKVRNQ